MSSSRTTFQYVLEGCDETYISPRLWQYCFNDKRPMNEMCWAMACVPHSRTDAARAILKCNPTNRALISIIRNAPEVREEAWEILKQRGPREEDLISVMRSPCHSSIVQAAMQLLNAIRSPEKKAFLEALEKIDLSLAEAAIRSVMNGSARSPVRSTCSS